MNRVLSSMGILMFLAVIARGAPNPSLLPVQEGNYWILQSSLGDQKVVRCEPGTNNLVQVTGLLERPVTFYGHPRGTALYRWDPGRLVPLPFPTPDGQLYRRQKAGFRRVVTLRPFNKGQSVFTAGDHPCDQLLVALDPGTVTVRTQLSEYSDCSALSVTTANQPLFTPCDILSERIFFAPGIGPVAIQGRLGRVYLLVEAQVGDILIGGQ